MWKRIQPMMPMIRGTRVEGAAADEGEELGEDGPGEEDVAGPVDAVDGGGCVGGRGLGGVEAQEE